MSAFGGLSQVPLKNSGIAPKVRIANDCNATLIDNKQLRPHLRERTVRLRSSSSAGLLVLSLHSPGTAS